MQIDDVNRPPQTQAAERNQLGSQNAREKKAALGADRSEISNLAQGLGGASDERLEALRSAVEAGTYRVSATGLADKLIEFHLKP